MHDLKYFHGDCRSGIKAVLEFWHRMQALAIDDSAASRAARWVQGNGIYHAPGMLAGVGRITQIQAWHSWHWPLNPKP